MSEKAREGREGSERGERGWCRKYSIVSGDFFKCTVYSEEVRGKQAAGKADVVSGAGGHHGSRYFGAGRPLLSKK